MPFVVYIVVLVSNSFFFPFNEFLVNIDGGMDGHFFRSLMLDFAPQKNSMLDAAYLENSMLFLFYGIQM